LLRVTGSAERAVGASAFAARDLAALVRFRTVSSEPRRGADLRRCADWLAERLHRAGVPRVQVVAGVRHPTVIGETRGSRKGPAVLLYSHYDVQPPGPRSEWRTPPFEPVVRGPDLFGRGASDDKGQLLCHVYAVEGLLRRAARLPVDVVFVLDGEEEIGSPSLADTLRALARRRRIGAALISDTRMLRAGVPALTVSLRGSLALDLTIGGPARDLHSGAFGGAVHNPLQGLCEVVSALHHADGRIAIPGAYARAREVAPSRMSVRTDREIRRETGVPALWGEPAFSAYERTTLRPALTVNGLSGGHQGPGAKAVIPAVATAKLSFRLVPDQRPDQVEAALRSWLAQLVPETLTWRLARQTSALPVAVNPHDAAHRAAVRACRRVWGRAPVEVGSGGSIAAAQLLAGTLRVPTVLLGFALPDDRAHGPNEKFHLPHLARGAATVAALLTELGAGQSRLPG
jgi:acetylornithine deacetylase/succinyl-diaminopimelate desuccinylase-like protein